jgi:hypothetical protein
MQRSFVKEQKLERGEHRTRTTSIHLLAWQQQERLFKAGREKMNMAIKKRRKSR